jgi:hypothetical protein
MNSLPTRDELQVGLRMRLDDDGRPTGTVRPERGATTAFVGWVSLMGELSRLLEAVHEAEQPNGSARCH